MVHSKAGLQSGGYVGVESLKEATWHHIALIVRRSDNPPEEWVSASSGQVEVYVDGLLHQTWPLPIGFAHMDSREGFFIGGPGSTMFSRTRIWKRALAAVELGTCSGVLDDKDLVLSFNFE